tara:strand:- start:387 stop:2825 length:2439 start_codon:yes stop_codon:yes gene_type:complete
MNNTVEHNIGKLIGSSQFFDGYLAEINHIDGSSLGPGSFGETNGDTGQWIPKAYSGSYGTNGFYITGADSTALGEDVRISGDQVISYAASQYTGATGSYTYSNGRLEADTDNKAIRTADTFAGDFEFSWRYNTMANFIIGVYETGEDGTFSDSSSAGNMQNMTDSWYIQTSSVSANRDIIYGGAVQVDATTIADGDTWKMTRSSGTIKLIRNGSDVHTFSQTSTNTVRIVIAQGDATADLGQVVWVDNSTLGNSLFSSGLAAADQVTDTPTDNHCVLNVLDGAGTVSDGNLVNASTSGWMNRRMTFGVPNSGKWAFRVKKSGNNFMVGVIAPQQTDGDPDQNNIDTVLYYDEGGTSSGDIQTRRTGSKVVETTDPPAGIAADTFMEVLIDKDNNRLGVVIGGTAYIAVDSGVAIQDTMTQIFVATHSGVTATVDFGQSGFTPSQTGYKALSTANLDDPTIADPSKYFQTTLYTGNGSTQSITNTGNSDLQPDLVWIKNRDAADSHVLTDAVRGATKILATDSTGAESTDADTVTAFASDGFALGDDDKVNTNTENYVSWQWKADSAWSEDATGNILASSGRRNTTAGFSICSWTHQTSGNYAIKHGLSTTPEFFMTKNRESTTNWDCWHKDLADTAKRILINTTGAEITAYWVDASDSADGSGSYGDISSGESPVTASLFGFQHDNFSATDDIIGYFFHSVEGFSKIDSYTGNGNADGPFVYTGFKPQWILFRVTSTTDAWQIYDIKRYTTNPFGRTIAPNDSAVEGSFSARLDILSNGFKVRTTNTALNGSGENYIFMAFAENPFKTATAR